MKDNKIIVIGNYSELEARVLTTLLKGRAGKSILLGQMFDGEVITKSSKLYKDYEVQLEGIRAMEKKFKENMCVVDDVFEIEVKATREHERLAAKRPHQQGKGPRNKWGGLR